MEQNTNARRARRNAVEIKELLSSFEKCDLTVEDFCKQYNISKGTFYYWRARFHKSETTSDAAFASLRIRPSASATESSLFAEVRGIKIYQPVAASYLKELLQ